MKTENKLSSNVIDSILDPNFIHFELMRLAYRKTIQDEYSKDNNADFNNNKEPEANQENQSPVDRYIDEVSLGFANVWIEAYSKATGQGIANSRAFDNTKRV